MTRPPPKDKLDRFGPKGKAGGQAGEKTRYAWHACWHDDAWRGIELMPPDIVGVYWRIILLMYRRRSALPDDDATMAMACFTSVKQYRRAKRALLGAQRVEVDEENGLLYCTRAVKQLVRDDRYREAQGARGKKGGRPSLAVDNVAVFPTDLRPTSSRDGGQVSAKLGGGNSGDKQALDIENAGTKKSPGKATYTQREKPLPATPIPGAAQPPRGGGARAALDAISATERAAIITVMRGALEGKEGKDEGAGKRGVKRPARKLGKK